MYVSRVLSRSMTVTKNQHKSTLVILRCANRRLFDILGVGDREWLYRTTFDCETAGPKAHLVFEGLDTFCTVYLVSRERARSSIPEL